MNSLVPSSYLVNQSNKTVYQRVMSLVSAMLNRPERKCYRHRPERKCYLGSNVVLFELIVETVRSVSLFCPVPACFLMKSGISTQFFYLSWNELN